MLKVDRSNYCPSRYPYMDAPYSIGYGATISAPHMHAYALEALKDKLVDGSRALDVGSGSGYLTSCMAHMVGPSGTVFGVEHIKELVKQSEENIRRDCSELLDSGRVKLFGKCVVNLVFSYNSHGCYLLHNITNTIYVYTILKRPMVELVLQNSPHSMWYMLVQAPMDCQRRYVSQKFLM